MFSRISRGLLSANLSLLFIGLMAFLPFIIFKHKFPVPSFYGEWVAGIFGLLALGTLLKREAWQPLEIPNIALIFPGLIALLFIQWQLGMLHSAPFALLVASYMIWAFLLAILGGYLRKQLGWERLATALAWCLMLGGVLNSVYVLLQLLAQNGFQLLPVTKFNGYGAIGQANHFANHSALALASLVYLYVRGSIGKSLGWAVAILFLVMLTLSGSRSTWLYLSAFFVLAFVFRMLVISQETTRTQADMQQSSRLFKTALLLLPVFALVQLIIFFIFDATGLQKAGALPTERLMSETAAVSGLTVRLQIWQESLQLFMQSPWLGIGFGQMRWETFSHLNPDGAHGLPHTFEHAHNLLIHLLTEMGVFSVLLVLAGLVAWLRAFAWRHLALSSWWLLAILAVIGIHSLLEYPLWYAYFLGLAAFLLGAGEEKCAQVRLPFTGRALIVTALVLATFHLSTTYRAQEIMREWIYKSMADGVQPEEWDEMRDGMVWVEQKSLFAPYSTMFLANILPPDEQNLEQKIAITESALRFMPVRRAAYKYSLLLALDGQREAAVKHLSRTLEIFPKNVTKEIESMPFQYWQLYVELLQEARPNLSILNKE